MLSHTFRPHKMWVTSFFGNQVDGKVHSETRNPWKRDCASETGTVTWIFPPVCSKPLRRSRQPATSCCKQAIFHREGRCSRRSVLLSVAASISWLPLREVYALCGEPDPYFIHFVDWQEDFATCGNRQIHYRIIGSKKKEKKSKKYPVVYLGDAGTAIASGETLELLSGSDRRVLFVDQLGVGESQGLDAEQKPKWSELAADEVSSVLLKADIASKTTRTKIHIVAVGFGIEVADVLLKRSGTGSTGYQVASVVAEGWSLPQKAKDVSFSALQGERVCAAEGADGGNSEILRTVYGNGTWNSERSLKDISASVPVLALRMKDWPSLKSQESSIRQRELDGNGRIPHLAATDECLQEMKSFFDETEGMEAN